MATLIVPVTKSKGTVELDLDRIPEDVYREIILQGAKVVLNRGMSKITVAELGDTEKVKAEAQTKAEANLQDIYNGNTKITGAPKSKKASGAVMVEARRIAKNLVKDAIKREGGKLSHYDAKDITLLANQLLEVDPTIIDKAAANIAERDETKSLGIDLSQISANPKKVAKAAEEKAKRPISAAQAGKTKKHKPSQSPMH